MNISGIVGLVLSPDGVMAISVVLTVVLLLWSVAGKYLHNWPRLKGWSEYGRLQVVPFLLLAIGAIYGIVDGSSEWLILSVSFGLALGAGFLMQPLVADPYLCARTLHYKDLYFPLFKQTPLWMACLWATALTQLIYFFLRMSTVTVFGPTVDFWLLVAIGFAYFLVFEWIVGNYTDWWERLYCWHVAGMAVYALVAEFFTVVFLLIVCDMNILEDGLRGSDVVADVPVGVIFGLAIANIFIVSCKIAYRPHRNR